MLKILLVDDEESIVKVLSMSLRSDGYEVVTSSSGEESLKTFKDQVPDIVITDLKMPGMSGLEVLSAMKEINSEAEVIIITGHGDMDSAIEALQFGASDFINKPIRDEVLSIALNRAKEKLSIRRKLKEYTDDLEHMVKIATEDLRQKSDFMAKLISSSNDGIVATDEKGEIDIFNPGAERIFGYSRSEVIGKKDISEICPSEVVKELKGIVTQKKNVAASPWQEIDLLSKSKETIPARYSGSILFDQGKVIGSVAFFQDLREIKRLEMELVRSERLAAIGQTVAGLAHYIKNILTGLKGGAYIAQVAFRKKDINKLADGWDMMQKHIGRISDLVLNLLSYSKERLPEYEKCNPNDIIDEVCELVNAKAVKNNIKIIKDLDLSIKELLMDQQTIHRSLLNLVSNAFDACIFDDDTNKKWEIKIKSSLDGENKVRFDVSDNGIGMSEEVRDKLFTSFFSTKMGKGTGLGLLVTKKLIEEHDGKIDFISESGKGSKFTIWLSYYNKK